MCFQPSCSPACFQLITLLALQPRGQKAFKSSPTTHKTAFSDWHHLSDLCCDSLRTPLAPIHCLKNTFTPNPSCDLEGGGPLRACVTRIGKQMNDTTLLYLVSHSSIPLTLALLTHLHIPDVPLSALRVNRSSGPSQLPFLLSSDALKGMVTQRGEAAARFALGRSCDQKAHPGLRHTLRTTRDTLQTDTLLTWAKDPEKRTGGAGDVSQAEHSSAENIFKEGTPLDSPDSCLTHLEAVTFLGTGRTALAHTTREPGVCSSSFSER